MTLKSALHQITVNTSISGQSVPFSVLQLKRFCIEKWRIDDSVYQLVCIFKVKVTWVWCYWQHVTLGAAYLSIADSHIRTWHLVDREMSTPITLPFTDSISCQQTVVKRVDLKERREVGIEVVIRVGGHNIFMYVWKRNLLCFKILW